MNTAKLDRVLLWFLMAIIITVIAFGTMLYNNYKVKAEFIESSKQWEEIDRQKIRLVQWYKDEFEWERCWRIALSDRNMIEYMDNVLADPYEPFVGNTSCAIIMEREPSVARPPLFTYTSPTNYTKWNNEVPQRTSVLKTIALGSGLISGIIPAAATDITATDINE